MKYYILKKLYVDKDGNAYWPRHKPYSQVELPSNIISKDDYVTFIVDKDEEEEPKLEPRIKSIEEVEININMPNKVVTPLHVSIEERKDTTTLVIEDKVASNISTVEEKNISLPVLNINTASLDEIAKLPGLTTGVAEKVIAARNSGRIFQTTDELNTDFKLPFGRVWSNLAFDL